MIRLRAVTDADVERFFEHQRDPEATAMAAFPARDLDAHRAHWANTRANEDCLQRTIEADGEPVGNLGSWTQDGHREVGYWIDREHWGKGITTEALRLFLAVERTRPLYAWVEERNVGSMRVLEKCGFTLLADQPRDPPTHLVFELRTG